VRGHMGDVNTVACDGEKQVIWLGGAGHHWLIICNI
jgi:hypothetical protein